MLRPLATCCTMSIVDASDPSRDARVLSRDARADVEPPPRENDMLRCDASPPRGVTASVPRGVATSPLRGVAASASAASASAGDAGSEAASSGARFVAIQRRFVCVPVVAGRSAHVSRSEAIREKSSAPASPPRAIAGNGEAVGGRCTARPSWKSADAAAAAATSRPSSVSFSHMRLMLFSPSNMRNSSAVRVTFDRACTSSSSGGVPRRALPCVKPRRPWSTEAASSHPKAATAPRRAASASSVVSGSPRGVAGAEKFRRPLLE
mmetsp:Transcript_19302/g.66190  ORF Transcript_19302/g.66190 Transcript_19302/m.66190 type:complete len:265 (+) Transcript_19302:852-1646(+)